MTSESIHQLPQAAKTCSRVMAIIFLFSIVFHLLTIAGFVPNGIVMGGNISDRDHLVVAEVIALLINLVFLLIVLSYLGFLRLRIGKKGIRLFFWVMFVLFTLNTAGNLMARSKIETFVFTPVTLTLAICSLVVALKGFRTTP